MKPRMPNTCQVKQVKTEFKNPIILTSALIRSLMTCAYSVPNCSKPDRHEAEKNVSTTLRHSSAARLLSMIQNGSVLRQSTSDKKICKILGYSFEPHNAIISHIIFNSGDKNYITHAFFSGIHCKFNYYDYDDFSHKITNKNAILDV